MKAKTLSMLTLAAIMLASCSKDDPNGPGPQTETGQESVVTLTIYDGTVGTRAAGTDIDNPTTDESILDHAAGLKVVVFDKGGTLVYPTGGALLNLTLTDLGSGVYRTAPFELNSGDKYFYIFANDASGRVPSPAGMNRSQFISQTTASTLDASDELELTDPNFLMGTLWSETRMVPGGGTSTSPANVSLTIGRLVSKVTLEGVSKGSSTMQGTFGTPEYRIGTIPKKIFLTGNNDETQPTPPALGHGIVKSAVHDAVPYTGSTDVNYQQYTATWNNVTDSFYTVENTTAPDDNGVQYYGNVTYIQIRTVYTPDDSEVYNVDDLAPQSGPFAGPTFYTANLISTGERLIFEKDPRTAAGQSPNADIDQNSIQVYTSGLNYHKFAINDPAEALEVQKNVVLRNHSYRYKVTSIADIGSPGEDVDPKEPIESPTTIEINVTISPWSKIENLNVPI